MKKLKPFSVKSMASLSREEMALINGGEFLPFNCYYAGQKCVIPAHGGVNTGTCQYVSTSISSLELTCIYLSLAKSIGSHSIKPCLDYPLQLKVVCCGFL